MAEETLEPQSADAGNAALRTSMYGSEGALSKLCRKPPGDSETLGSRRKDAGRPIVRVSTEVRWRAGLRTQNWSAEQISSAK